MKTYFTLLLLVMSIHALGQEGIARSQNLPGRQQELKAAKNSDYIDTFAKALNDPNVVIGVFERPKVVPNVMSVTTLSSGEILEELSEYWQAMKHSHLPYQFKCVKPIKGEFTEPMVFVFAPPFIMIESRPNFPIFAPFPETKWILALKKTSHEYRADRIKGIENYKFLNDETVFSLFHWGHGALCLQWPEKELQPPHMVHVSENLVKDLEAIERAMPHIQKKQREPADTAALNNTKSTLKTAHAKSIFDRLRQEWYQRNLKQRGIYNFDTESLINNLNNEKPAIRILSVSLLGERKELSAMQQMEEMLQDESFPVRLSAVQALLKMDNRDDIAVLKDFSDKISVEIKAGDHKNLVHLYDASRVLADAGEVSAIPHLRELQKFSESDKAWLRLGVVRSLGKLHAKDNTVSADIVCMLNDEDPQVRKTALKVLREIEQSKN